MSRGVAGACKEPPLKGADALVPTASARHGDVRASGSPPLQCSVPCAHAHSILASLARDRRACPIANRRAARPLTNIDRRVFRHPHSADARDSSSKQHAGWRRRWLKAHRAACLDATASRPRWHRLRLHKGTSIVRSQVWRTLRRATSFLHQSPERWRDSSSPLQRPAPDRVGE